MSELLIGCGNSRRKMISPAGRNVWTNLTTLDIDPNCGADVEWDLERLPYPFEDNQFDEIHGYHVLEHFGQQGDYRAFFAHFSEFWRLLKPGGYLCAQLPAMESEWAWGDPGHTRVIGLPHLAFLDQAEYTKQVGKTMFTDYRHVYRADFAPTFAQQDGITLSVALVAVKPSRISL